MFKISFLQKNILLFCVLYVVYIITVNIFTLPEIKDTVKNLEKKIAKEVVDKIVILSKSVNKDIVTYRANSLERHKEELKLQVNIVWNYIDAKYKQIGIKGTSEELKHEVIEMVRSLDVEDKSFALIDYNNLIISSSYAQGINASHIRDVKGDLSVVVMVKEAQEKGETFRTFWWQKKMKVTKAYQKLSYMKNYPKWDMTLASGVFINEIDENVQKRKDELLRQLNDIVDTTKIGKTGYLYIFDEAGKILIHSDDDLVEKVFKDKLIYEKLVEAAKTSHELRYKWDKPNDKGNYVYDAIAWVEYIPELKQYVASFVYVDELEESSVQLQKNIIYIGIVVLIISIILSILIFRKLLKPIYILSNLANIVARGNYSVRADIKSSDEFEQLSKDFNLMVETIEDHIHNLDDKVREKTVELEKLAITDKLTGLSNRVLLDKELSAKYENYLRYKHKFSIILIDIDFFKNVNDTYGHLVGDHVLKEVSSRIQNTIRSTDILGRWGGEEFLIIISNTDLFGVYQLAENIRKVINSNVFDEAGQVTISAGIAEINSDLDVNTILANADEALYRAKNNGRDRVEDNPFSKNPGI